MSKNESTVASVQNRPRGFAAMSPERQREIARMGGRAVHAAGLAHRWTSEEASAAGKLGGEKMAAIPGHMAELGRKGGAAASVDRERMAEIGRKGGLAVARKPGHMQAIGKRGGNARKQGGDEA